jgi:hypothetical protein
MKVIQKDSRPTVNRETMLRHHPSELILELNLHSRSAVFHRKSRIWFVSDQFQGSAEAAESALVCTSSGHVWVGREHRLRGFPVFCNVCTQICQQPIVASEVDEIP